MKSKLIYKSNFPRLVSNIAGIEKRVRLINDQNCTTPLHFMERFCNKAGKCSLSRTRWSIK